MLGEHCDTLQNHLEKSELAYSEGEGEEKEVEEEEKMRREGYLDMSA